MAPSAEQVAQAHALLGAAVKCGRLQHNFSVFGVRSSMLMMGETMLVDDDDDDALALFNAMATSTKLRRHWSSVIRV